MGQKLKTRQQTPAFLLCRTEQHEPVRVKTVPGEKPYETYWLIACKHCGQEMGYEEIPHGTSDRD